MDSGGCGLRSIPLPRSLGDRTNSGTEEERRAAFTYFAEAWAEARLEGIDGDCLAQVALFSALNELVSTYGEEPTARYADGLADRIRHGEFTVPPSRQ
jgi:hypothetical protein